MDDLNKQIQIYREKLDKIKGKSPADEGLRGVIEDDIARLTIEAEKDPTY